MAKDYLTLKQAANFLKVTDSVVKEMIKSKVFKASKKGNTYQIQKAEVDEWLANLNEREVEQLALKRSVCRFSDYFKVKNVFLDFHADNKYEAIAEMAKKAKELKIVKDHRWLYQVVVAREELVSTAIGKGIALLHPRHFHPSKIKKPSILFGRSKDEIEFDAIDNKPVKLFFLLLLHDDVQHLFSISYISKLLMNEENLKHLLEAETAEEVEHALIKKVLN
ncbi:MAG: PTS sugar transporter subunit IIA [Candidatus Cloacimonetes bacterium]|nr:PTS sugar transporter subunit IIA [Candidatus Cloacimonadota bacterium]MCF7813851.1 PTS sugar transporter subunit IIA [Candidatus Cloacimonadota bacterium]MCF7868289.1 PTS sugar transporter subunit IIA [Candidatus Cloacimonadota bacterium]MCF7883737.1 PTS sugar transporter subunit IIA [Candidatus Cloacimonadota bacterium]